jgi:hypothetical protein
MRSPDNTSFDDLFAGTGSPELVAAARREIEHGLDELEGELRSRLGRDARMGTNVLPDESGDA